MPSSVYHNTDFHGNYLDNAKVRDIPQDDRSIVNKGHLTDMMVAQGLDGFVEGVFSVKDIVIINNIFNDKTIYQNMGYKVFCVVETDDNSRPSHTITGSLKFGEYTVDFNLGPYTPQQSESIYGITIKDNQLLYVFDPLLQEQSERYQYILPNLTAVTFLCKFEETTITYEGHEVTHNSVTLSESCTSQEYRYRYELYPLILPLDTYITSLAGLDIDTSYLPNSGVETNIEDVYYFCEVSNPNNIKALLLTPTSPTRRYYITVLDENDNPITEKTYIPQANINYDFTWLGDEWAQTLISLGYIPEAVKLLISFDK